MKFFRLRLAFYGAMLALLFAPILGQTIFANDITNQENSGLEIVYDDGSSGLARIPIPEGVDEDDGDDDGTSLLAPRLPDLRVYSTWTSYTNQLCNNNMTYYAWLDRKQIYLYVSFKVVGKQAKAKINWIVNKTGTGALVLNETTDFKDPVSGSFTLDPRFWYFAWYHPEGPNENLIKAKGMYKYVAKVTVLDSDCNPIKTKRAYSRFWVVREK